MAMPIRPLATSLIVVGSFVVVSVAYPSFVQDIGADFWNVNRYQSESDRAEESMLAFDRQSAVVQKRIELKREAIQNCVSGLASFEETVQCFAAINRDFRTGQDFTQRFPGATSDDRTAWQVVGYLKATHLDAAFAIAYEWDCILLARLHHAQ